MATTSITETDISAALAPHGYVLVSVLAAEVYGPGNKHAAAACKVVPTDPNEFDTAHVVEVQFHKGLFGRVRVDVKYAGRFDRTGFGRR